MSGTIRKVRIVNGTYYLENQFEGFADPQGADPSAPNNSQPFLTSVATRALIFIEADNPKIGLMCVVPVGMAEVSSCEITVQAGDRVKKGISSACSTSAAPPTVCCFAPASGWSLTSMARPQGWMRPIYGSIPPSPGSSSSAGLSMGGRLRAALLHSGLLPEKQIQVGAFYQPGGFNSKLRHDVVGFLHPRLKRLVLLQHHLQFEEVAEPLHPI